ncbi:DUF3068 domain-containing protein, partial [Algoriphagus aestuarii]|nr:DUF3068 domain-containing protein [Algoriphagus aestuarii]
MTRAEDTAEPQPVDQTGEERQPTVRRRPPRGAGLLTTMLGAFCLTAALLLPLVVAPRLALLPAEFHYTWTLLDPHATYLDTAHWQTRENVEVKQTVSTRGTPVPGAPGLVAVATTIDT